MSPGRTRLAISVLSTALAIAAATAAATAARWEGVPSWSWMALLFLPVLTAGSSLFVRMQFRDQVLALDLFEAVLAPAVFVLPGPSLVAAVAAAVATSELMRRNSPVKAIFNVAQWSAAAAAGSLVMAGALHLPRERERTPDLLQTARCYLAPASAGAEEENPLGHGRHP